MSSGHSIIPNYFAIKEEQKTESHYESNTSTGSRAKREDTEVGLTTLSRGLRQAELLPSQLWRTEPGKFRMRPQQLLICSKFNSIQGLQRVDVFQEKLYLVQNMKTK